MLVVRQHHVLYAVGLCVLLLFLGTGYKHTHKAPMQCAALTTKEQRKLCTKMANAQRKPVIDLRLRIMAVGDSVTLSPLGQNAYREDLVRMLWADNDLETVGETFWGTMKEEKYNRLEAFMGRNMPDTVTALQKSIPKWKPNVLLIHIGTNEIIGDKEEELAYMPGKLDEMLDIIAREVPDALTIVAQVIPCVFRLENVERWNRELYERVALRVASTKQHVLTVDMFTDWPADGLADVAHPNAVGYKVMADRWYAGLELANGMGWLKTTNAVTEPVNKELEKELEKQKEIEEGIASNPTST